MGMAISHELANRLGAEIDVVSELGRGSTFTLSVPVGLPRPELHVGAFELKELPIKAAHIEPLELSPTAPEKPASSLSSADKLRVLCVDDSTVALRLLTTLCQKAGVEWRQAEDGQIAVDLFHKEVFDVVLTDLTMPNLDGLRAAIAMREIELDENRPRSKIVIISAAAEVTHPPPEIDQWCVSSVDARLTGAGCSRAHSSWRRCARCSSPIKPRRVPRLCSFA